MSKKKSAWKYWIIPFYPLYKLYRYLTTPKYEKGSMAQQLSDAAKRATFSHNSAPVANNNSANTVRIRMKDGTELHTEQRFGDYKTYIYDQSGNNTGLHISGDKVYDDNWKEVGHFDGNGDFKPQD